MDKITCISFYKMLINYVFNKLMRSNRPQAKIRFKSDWNRLFIDFFKQISAFQSTRCNESICIRTIYIANSLISIENSLILIENSSILIENG